MFSLTIVFGPGPMVWTLMFKTLESAAAAGRLVGENEGSIGVSDDFGQNAVVTKSQVHGWMLEDLEQSRLAHIERALHQARTQAKGAELADADPTLRQARLRQQGGMPMIQPVPGMQGFGPNGRFPS